MPAPAPPLSIDSAPLWPLGVVTHIGSLNPAHKGCRGESYEGTGLSVSCHPEEWEAIARLGGQAWWQVDASGLRLVDGHAFLRDHAQALAHWGQQEGLVVPGTCFAVRWFDEEFDQDMEMLFATAAQARQEAEDREATVEPRAAWLPTAALLEQMGHDPARAGAPDPDTLAALATVWAHRAGMDGMWWDDTLDPDCLSAPRGVIFPHVVPALAFELVRPAPAPRPPRR